LPVDGTDGTFIAIQRRSERVVRVRESVCCRRRETDHRLVQFHKLGAHSESSTPLRAISVPPAPYTLTQAAWPDDRLPLPSSPNRPRRRPRSLRSSTTLAGHLLSTHWDGSRAALAQTTTVRSRISSTRPKHAHLISSGTPFIAVDTPRPPLHSSTTRLHAVTGRQTAVVPTPTTSIPPV